MTENIKIFNTGIQVTYYYRKIFGQAFPDYILDLDTIKASLSPKYNRSQIFKSGEGAGRSGSFFFFSHDNKFIVKTLTK